MFSKSDISRDEFQLFGKQAKCGYDWWWHSFTAIDEETNTKKQFFLEFFTCNPKLGGDEPVYGQLPRNKMYGVKPSYLMIKVGTWGENKKQLHRFFGWNKVEIEKKKPFSIKADDCYLSETESHGKVSVSREDATEHKEYMSDAGTIEWNLKINKLIPFNVGYGAGKLFRTIQAFEMFWHAEGMKTEFSGEIILDGKTYKIVPEESNGYSDKNWGKDFTSPWVWLSTSNCYSKKYDKKLENTVFDIGGGKPKVGPITLNRKLLSAMYYEGKCFEFNFSKFWTFCRTKFVCQETEDQIVWHVEQKTWRNRMVTDITCEKKDMLFVNYEAPNGTKKYSRLWNGGNGKGTIMLYRKGELVDEIEVTDLGCEYGEFDTEQ